MFSSLSCTCQPLQCVCRYEMQDILGYMPASARMLTALLCFLVLLHAYWFSLIANIAWSKITTGSARDTREEDD